ncbi:MAG: DoxX family protein [Flavobacteriales bacterium CG11_big_fil_rev_8_21_14_0_20_35_7]|nr:MAG: DoxX family protein [Flavobacteriales bacterium CG11_big_fil_rev_8_21_14_0_20_35_7]PJA06088.1 MAG: DoxX family protein [Flavobacteriales bacterium CG_4_10_14_0_2_um_filter_35_18]
MKIITQLLRVLVGITFVFSGFVKLVDPLGSTYKFEEYFSKEVLNLTFLSPLALEFSVILILAELLLGVMLLVGFKSKFTTFSLLFLISLFLFLTWYSAYYNKVTDCGCFGDAITLTTWQTFYKNVVLIFMILWLVIKQKDIKPLLGNFMAKSLTVLSFVASVFILYQVLTYLPIIDFRPYAIGKNISEGMRIPDDAQKAVYKDTWIYKVNGVAKTYITQEAPWNIPGAVFVSRKTEMLKAGYQPPIHDFTMEKDGENRTEKLLQEPKLMLIVMYNIDKSTKNGLKQIKNLSDKALANGYQVFAMSASPEADFLKIKTDNQLNFDLLFCDETTLKTMIRANPGVIMLNKGTITEKWSWRSAKKIEF